MGEPNIYLIFGTAMHETLQEYLDVMYKKSVKEANSLDMNLMLRDYMMVDFQKYKDELGKNPCTLEELKEFHNDGILIIEYFLKHRAEYFPSRSGWELIGCEVPIELDLKKSINWIGYLDIVLYHKPTDMIKIIDIKTATKGWTKYHKKDKNKTSQLLLYKQFYSKQYNHPVEKIEIEYFIVKRKLYENVDWPQKRIQKFVPASGKPSLNKVSKTLNIFLNESFNDDGTYKIKDYEKNASKNNCRFCEFRDKPDLCDEGI
tara:strand:+ start:267 stop:1046 length:780 start_codon:yes stop_codon:yes gene_type:complete